MTRSFALLLCSVLVACGRGEIPASADDGAAGVHQGILDDGAAWIAEVPGNWNGALLLYAHGYDRELEPPAAAPESVRDALLAQGFALAASAYPTAGWAVADAVPSQVQALAAFRQRFGKPERVIAWGSSMGGLVSSALAERHAEILDGALTMCASSMGSVPMMNMAFDGAFALTTLVPIEPPVAIVGHGDNFDAVKRQLAAVVEARQTPGGRARVALAGVLGGIPGWTRRDQPRPAADDYVAQEQEIAAAIQWGIFLPRGDQERRAGGVFSWNDGIDYGRLLEASGRKTLVESLYSDAALDLAADIAALNKAPRVAADAAAVDYMLKNFTPSGNVGVPVLALHTLGDGMTSPSLQRSYIDKVAAASGSDMIAGLWIDRAGHCTQSVDEILAALAMLVGRIDSGAWQFPRTVDAEGKDIRFVEYDVPPVPRSVQEKLTEDG